MSDTQTTPCTNCLVRKLGSSEFMAQFDHVSVFFHTASVDQYGDIVMRYNNDCVAAIGASRPIGLREQFITMYQQAVNAKGE